MTQEEAKELKAALFAEFRRMVEWNNTPGCAASAAVTAMAHTAEVLIELERFAKKEQINLD